MLKFEISGQKMTRVDTFAPATDSKLYLKAGFTFSSDWAGAAKTAIFRDEVTGESYETPLNSSGVCTVPAEVLTRSTAVHYQTQGNHFHVSLRGDIGSTLITTNEVKVELARSGYTEGQTPAAPSADAYSQFVANVKADADRAAASAEAAAESESNVANLYANALKKTASGELVAVSDVSPVGHELGLRVYGKNLFNKNNYVVMDGVIMFDISNLVVGRKYVFSSNLPVTWFKISNYSSGYNSVAYSDAAGMTEIPFTMAKNQGIPENAVQYLLLSVAENYGSNPVKDLTELDGYNIQIEEGEAATAYTPWVDPTTVVLTRCGKSVFAVKDQTVAGTAAAWTCAKVAAVKVPPGDYVASCTFVQSGTDTSRVTLSVRDIDDLTETIGQQESIALSGSFVVPFTVAEGKNGFQVYLYSNLTAEELTTRCVFPTVMVEAGSTATNFEPYEGAVFTPAADGTVEGVKSLSPSMTLLTDTPGVVVEATYHRDLVKAIAALEAALLN